MRSRVELTFVNVGYGEAMIVEYKGAAGECGLSMVIDGGSADREEYEGSRTGRVKLSEYLRLRGVEHLDYMVATHIHEDHICGLTEVAGRIPVKQLWQLYPEDFYKSVSGGLSPKGNLTNSRKKFMEALNAYPLLCKQVADSGGSVRCVSPGDCGLLAEGLAYQILGPAREKQKILVEDTGALFSFGDGLEKRLDSLDRRMNNYSMILKLCFAGVTILLPGDTNMAGYEGMPEEELKADIFKMGHHGQKDALNDRLLDVIAPVFAVCCASSDRRYNSGEPELLRKMNDRGIRLLFSDCPPLPEGMERVPEHKALKFIIGEEGSIDYEYET